MWQLGSEFTPPERKSVRNKAVPWLESSYDYVALYLSSLAKKTYATIETAEQGVKQVESWK